MAEPTLDPMANVAQLRQQLRARLQGNLAQGQDLLAAYQEAYPQLDMPTIQGALSPQPMYGVNIHGRPTDLSPAWIAEQTIEPVEFGSLADPVSQLAFLAAPGALRAGKTALETMGAPGPTRLGAFAGERGNLGPVPRGMRGDPLPESAVRDEAGQLKRLYHGTNRVYPDFATEKFSSGAGGDLYGPGIYMTENPQLAGEYATMYWDEHAKDALKGLQHAEYYKSYYMDQAAKARTLDEAMDHMQAASSYEPLIKQAQERMQRYVSTHEHQFRDPANIRPVYADLKKPFDIEASIPEAEARRLFEALPDATPENVAYRLDRHRPARWYGQAPVEMTGEQLYHELGFNLRSDKAAINKLLQEAGYDGITHIGGTVTGGQPHRVYIAFSPDTVYPSVNVEGTP